jgi:hypothetical protein
MSQIEFKTGGSSGFATGTMCTDTNLYKCTDNRMVYLEYIPAGTPFPKSPSGNGKGNTTWYKVTKSTDGEQTSFKAALVDAGSL